MTARDNQAATVKPQEPSHPRGSFPADAGTDPESQALTDYIRHIVDTAPRPTPAQLERLAGLLRDPAPTIPAEPKPAE